MVEFLILIIHTTCKTTQTTCFPSMLTLVGMNGIKKLTRWLSSSSERQDAMSATSHAQQLRPLSSTAGYQRQPLASFDTGSPLPASFALWPPTPRTAMDRPATIHESTFPNFHIPTSMGGWENMYNQVSAAPSYEPGRLS